MLRKGSLAENFIHEAAVLLCKDLTAQTRRKHILIILRSCAFIQDLFSLGGKHMETRVALIGIIVGNRNESAKLNEILHEYGQYVVGRMGVPYKDKDINVISLIVDAPQDVISALSGKLGMLPEVSTKTIYPPMPQ